MNCDHAEDLMSAYADGELEPEERRELEAHMSGCPECTERLTEMRAISRQMAANAKMTAPAGLAGRVRLSLAKEAHDTAARARSPWQPAWAQMAATFVLVSALSAAAGYFWASRESAADLVRHDLVASHMRALIGDMPLQVASSDNHTVKPWFAGKIDYSPEVKDLAADGFPLIGGRLDYIGSRRVGVLIYKRKLHWIDIYVWPSIDDPAAPSADAPENGYNILTWKRDGLTYRAVSDLNLEELRQLRDLL